MIPSDRLQESCVAALMALPHMTPPRLHRTLRTWPDPAAAVAALARGETDPVLATESRDRKSTRLNSSHT